MREPWGVDWEERGEERVVKASQRPAIPIQPSQMVTSIFDWERHKNGFVSAPSMFVGVAPALQGWRLWVQDENDKL